MCTREAGAGVRLQGVEMPGLEAGLDGVRPDAERGAILPASWRVRKNLDAGGLYGGEENCEVGRHGLDGHEQMQEQPPADGWERRYCVGSRFEVYPVPYVRVYQGKEISSLDAGVYCHRREWAVRISEPLYVEPDYSDGHRGCLLTWARGSVFLHFKGLLKSGPSHVADRLLDTGLLFDLSHAKDVLAYATACYAEGVKTTPDGAVMIPAGRLGPDSSMESREGAGCAF